MVEVQECTALAFGAYPQVGALVAEYAAESSIDGLPTPKPHEPSYLRLERAGIMHVLIALVDGAVVGFLVLLVNMNPHYGEKLAVIESFFVGKAHRKSGAGGRLLRRAEEIGRERGAIGLLLSAPVNSVLARIMEQGKRYRETNRVFFRSLA
jgi:GNAT superfamily N-acetyltransferase